MKGFVKFCLVASIGLLVVGGVFSIVGFSAVGKKEINRVVEEISDGRIHLSNGIQIGRNKKDRDEIRIETDDKINVFDYNGEKKKVADKSISELQIDLGGCYFELQESEDSNIYMAYEGKGKADAYVEGDCLYVEAANNKDGNTFSFILYVPQEVYFERVEMNLGAGQMKVQKLKTENMNLSIGAGEVQIYEPEAEKATISVGAGSVVLDEAKLEEVKAEVGAGNCEIQGEITGDIDAECALGNMSFVLSGEEADYDYEISCVTGNISINGEEYSGLAKEVEVDNNASKKMELECAMGNIEVEFEE